MYGCQALCLYGHIKITHGALKGFFAYSIGRTNPCIDQEGRFLGLAVIKLGGKFDLDSSLLRIHELLATQLIAHNTLHLGIQIQSSKKELILLNPQLKENYSDWNSIFFHSLGIIDGHHAQFSKESMLIRNLERITSVDANMEKVRIYSSELKDTRSRIIFYIFIFVWPFQVICVYFS